MAYGKGQMFIVTMVFLIALIFSVQQLLLQYTAIDLSAPPQTTDTYLVENIESAFQTALESSDDCGEARANVRELENLITRTIKGGYSIGISGDIACSPEGEWPSAPELTILVTVTGEASETKARFRLYREGPPLPLVFIEPEDQTRDSDPVNIDVSISGIEDLYGFQFDLTYEPGVLQFQGIEGGSFLDCGSGGSGFWIDPETSTPGSLKNAVCVRVGPVGGLDGDGVLASITFSIAGTGQSPITLVNVILVDPDGNEITSFNINDGTVNII